MKKQDVVVGDSSGTARLIVWGKEIEEVRSYRLSGMMVREFRGKKFLSTSKEMSAIERISDIGVVEEEEDESKTVYFYWVLFCLTQLSACSIRLGHIDRR